MNQHISLKRLKVLTIEQILKERVCPYCGETREFNTYNPIIIPRKPRPSFGIEHVCVHRSWYGKHDGDIYGFAPLRFWEKNRHWNKDIFICRTCQTTWLSPPYISKGEDK